MVSPELPDNINRPRGIRFYYPSGASAVISGEWKGPSVVAGDSFILILQQGKAHVLDPRGVYIDDTTGEVLYNPRTQAQITPWVLDWLREHPEWPYVAEIKGVIGPQNALKFEGDVPGALAAGTRVEKVQTEPGDTHKDGDRGTILGSISSPLGQIGYSVEWDDLPGMAVAISALRLRPVADSEEEGRK